MQINFTPSEFWAQVEHSKECINKEYNSFAIQLTQIFNVHSNKELVKSKFLNYLYDIKYIHESIICTINVIENLALSPHYFVYQVKVTHGKYINAENREKTIIATFYICPNIIKIRDAWQFERRIPDKAIIYKCVTKDEFADNVKRYKVTMASDPNEINTDFKVSYDKCINFLNNIDTQIKYRSEPLSTVIERLCEDYISKFNINFISIPKESKFFDIDKCKKSVESYLDINNEDNSENVKNFKIYALQLLYMDYIVRMNNSTRNTVLAYIKQDRLETYIRDVSLNDVLNKLDRKDSYFNVLFNTGKKANKYSDVVKNCYLSELNGNRLDEKLKILLRLCYEMYHITEANADMLAKCIIEYKLKIKEEFLVQLERLVTDIDPIIRNLTKTYKKRLIKDNTIDFSKFLDSEFRHTFDVWINRVIWPGDGLKIEVVAEYNQDLLKELKDAQEAFNQRSPQTRLINIMFGKEDDQFIYDFFFIEPRDKFDGRVFSLLTEITNESRNSKDVVYFAYSKQALTDMVQKDRESRIGA